MKEVNILSIVQAHKTLNTEIRDRYYHYNQIEFKPQELDCLTRLTEQLLSLKEPLK